MAGIADDTERTTDGNGPSSSHCKYVIIIIILLGLIAFANLWNQIKPRGQWEYLVQGIPDERVVADLNSIGRQGWEIVSARRAISGPAEKPTFVGYELILKRSATGVGDRIKQFPGQ